MTALTREQRLYNLLTTRFSPNILEVSNESDQHAGHRGSPGTGESHYRVRIGAAALTGLSHREAHQRIYDAVGAEFKSGLHALSIQVVAPDVVASGKEDREC